MYHLCHYASLSCASALLSSMQTVQRLLHGLRKGLPCSFLSSYRVAMHPLTSCAAASPLLLYLFSWVLPGQVLWLATKPSVQMNGALRPGCVSAECRFWMFEVLEIYLDRRILGGARFIDCRSGIANGHHTAVATLLLFTRYAEHHASCASCVPNAIAFS